MWANPRFLPISEKRPPPLQRALDMLSTILENRVSADNQEGDTMSRCLKGVLSSLFTALFLAFVQPATAESVAPPSRIALVERVIATAEAAVADPRWVSGSQWEAFKNRIRDPDLQALETDEFVSAFNSAAGALPFSHFRLHWQPGSGGPEAAETSIVLTWPAEDIALVRMRAFEGDPAIVTQTMREVVA